MHIFGTPFDKIGWPLLEQLAEDHTAESLTHDYKRALPGKGHNLEKTDILADLASLANSAGGILVLGFDEATWTIPGVAGWDDGLYVKRLDDLSQNTVPALPTLRHRTLTRVGGQPVALVGVPRSLAAPHAVRLDQGWGFWARNNRGRHEMDVTEIRRAFLEAEQWERDAENFRHERIGWALENEKFLFARGEFPKKLYVHVLPLGRLRDRYDFDRDALEPHTKLLQLPDRSSNIDGLRKTGAEHVPLRWVQFFRHGGAEACLDLSKAGVLGGTEFFDGRQVDTLVYDIAGVALSWLRVLGVASPYVLGLTAIEVRGCGIAQSREYAYDAPRFDRPKVFVPLTTVERDDLPVSGAVRPALDMLWQASGWLSGSPSFRDDGSLDSSRP